MTRLGLRVAMALYGDITYDSRVMREAETLSAAGHSVTVYCLAGSAPIGATFKVVAQAPHESAVLPDGSSPFLKRTGGSVLAKVVARTRWVSGYARNLRSWGRWAAGAAGPVDVWHAHDLTSLMAMGPVVKAPCRLVYDSHEIFLETGTGARLPGPIRRLLSRYEGTLARRAVALVTVNEGYAQVLQRRLRPRRTLIVRNCPPRWDPAFAKTAPLRVAVGVTDDQPLILYHGLLSTTRGIEELTQAMLLPGLEEAHVALLGFGPSRNSLEELTLDPRFDGRLHVIDAVPPSELLEWVAGADLNVIALQHSTLNHWFCTPNKLWESLAAGVPVVVSDFPVMRRIVVEDPTGPLGWLCDPADPGSIAAAIGALIGSSMIERAELRARCRQAALDRWNWETESSKLVELYEEMAGSGPSTLQGEG